MAIFWRGPHNGGVEYRWGRQTSWFATNIWLSINDCCNANNNSDGPLCSLLHRHASVNFVDRNQHGGQRQREQDFLVHSGKSAVEVTNSRRSHSTYCTIEANYWQTRSIVRPLCIITYQWGEGLDQPSRPRLLVGSIKPSPETPVYTRSLDKGGAVLWAP